MPTEIVWLASRSASALYAARAAIEGRQVTDPRLTGALAGPADHLRSAVSRNPVTGLEQLVAHAASLEDNRRLAQVALLKSVGKQWSTERAIAALARAVAAVKTAYLGAVTEDVDALALRGGPFRTQWEAYGPGLLAAVGRLTDPALITGRAEVVLVHPATGGGGIAHLAHNRVSIEAMLANPDDELPEVLRLAWLVAQLQLDLPMHSESIAPDRLAVVSGLAKLPPILAAAAELGMGPCRDSGVQQPHLEAAVARWTDAPEKAAPLATALADWWTTYTAARPPTRVALAALEQMTGPILDGSAPTTDA